jgi:hypothetical protein
MTSIVDSSVKIQTTSESNPSTPSWFGEVVVISSYLRKHGVLSKINEQVRFARKRFGRYEVLDFLAMLFDYAISGERTLEEFYQRLQPFAVPFMAVFGRDRLPSRSALSRFLAALTEAPVEALRTLFLDDLLGRPLTPDKQTGSLLDRVGNAWVVFDIDGTREAAHQRALPQTDELPPPFRRLDDVCAPGYRGRKRGEVVRTRTTISQAHSSQWLGSFGNRGNGRYREELRKALAAIDRYLTAYQFPKERALLRLDGQYDTGAVLTDVAGFAFVTRGKEYRVLDHPLVQVRLHLPPDQVQQRPESQMVRSLYDCPQVQWDPRACCAAWSWPPILWAQRRSPLASRVRAPSMNSSSPTCRSRRFLPATWSNCICIVAPLSPRKQMRIESKIPIVGAPTRPGDKSAGNWSPNGSGTCDWNWGIFFRRLPCVSLSLLRLSRSPRRTRLPQQAMLLPR